MRIVIQRVNSAQLKIDGKERCSIGHGLLLFLGIEENDELKEVISLSAKVVKMRLFNDAEGLMNLSVKAVSGELLLVSQFTLYANTRKGNRPSFIKAAKREKAIPLYQAMIAQLQLDLGREIKTGIFGADMKVELVNDGPVTIILDSKS